MVVWVIIMIKIIIFYHVVLVLVILVVVFSASPLFWLFIGLLASLLAWFFSPFRLSAESVPKGFTEKKFDTGKVVLNYVEGPDNGRPLLFIPGQMEFWQGYKLVLPKFSKDYHVFVVDVRGHGGSTRTPGDYSYNSCGNDLKMFLEGVIKKPTVVSGLSSGGVLSVWLGANAPKLVSAVISEDPPLFSSMYPRIKKERYMYYLFKTAVDTLDKPKRDIKGFFQKQGIPLEGKKDLLMMPSFIANYVSASFEFNKKIRPKKKYDLFNADFNERVGLKFVSEYDVDFSKATIDGRLSRGFNPVSALKKINCPMLLIHANWSRHSYWGLLGALDDKDIELISSIVRDLTYVKVNSFHDIHLSKPKIFTKVVIDYLKKLSLD